MLSSCPSGYSSDTSHLNCYAVIANANINWQNASNACQVRSNGWLASITSQDEQSYLYSIIEDGFYWIGLNNINNGGTFSWQKGTVGYTNWSPGEPINEYGREHCVSLLKGWAGSNGTWSSQHGPCSVTWDHYHYSGGYICQTCSPGSFADASTTSPVCQLCPINSYSVYAGASACTPCPDGRYTNGELGATECRYHSEFSYPPLVAPTAEPVEVHSCSVQSLAGQRDNPGFINSIGTYSTFRNPLAGARSKSTGVVYIADNANNVIRGITVAGNSFTLAGNESGTSGRSNGVGTFSQFNFPEDVCLNNFDGNLYVTDRYNSAIRKINLATNEVSVFVGEIGVPGMMNGFGTAARFDNPVGVCFHDSDGTGYIADTFNDNIRVVTSSGMVTILAGSTTSSPGYANGLGTNALFHHPVRVSFNKLDGCIYVCEYDNHAIRRVTSAGMFTAVAGYGGLFYAGMKDGIGMSARFRHPCGVTVDDSGTMLFVADFDNKAIRTISLPSNMVSTLSCIPSTELRGPNAIYFVDGQLFVSDGNRLLKYDVSLYLESPTPTPTAFKEASRIPSMQPTAVATTVTTTIGGMESSISKPVSSVKIAEGMTTTTIKMFSRNNCRNAVRHGKQLLVCDVEE